MKSKSPALIPNRLSAYYAFRGLDRSRPLIGMDDGEKQPLFNLHNAHSHWTGTLKRDVGLLARYKWAMGEVVHQDFFDRSGLAFAIQDGKTISLYSERGANFPDAFQTDVPVTSMSFANKLYFMSPGFPMIKTDGLTFQKSTASIRPGFAVGIQGRIYAAGRTDRPKEISISRVFEDFPDDEIFTAEETKALTEVTRADFLDLANVLGSADEITGLARFESNRLAIFTNDQTIVFKVDPDYTQREIDNRANVQLGAISHNGIVQVGSDVIFCSRHGVHSLIRSAENGLTIDSRTLSYEVETLYKQLLKDCIRPRFVTATYDQDLGRLHIFFPMASGRHQQLVAEFRRGYESLTWATSDAGAARCGAFLAGSMTFGTRGTIYSRLDETVELQPEDDITDDFIRPAMNIDTPILWHGSIDEQKEATALVVQAAGSGMLRVSAFDEQGDELLVEEIAIQRRDDNPNKFPNDSLDLQFRLPFQLRYRGVQLRFESLDMGDIEILGFAIELKKA